MRATLRSRRQARSFSSPPAAATPSKVPRSRIRSRRRPTIPIRRSGSRASRSSSTRWGCMSGRTSGWLTTALPRSAARTTRCGRRARARCTTGRSAARTPCIHSSTARCGSPTTRRWSPELQLDQLVDRVDGRPYLMMSPYPGLSVPVSLQSWGHQLVVDGPTDARIDHFVDALRLNRNTFPEPARPAPRCRTSST